MKTLLLTSTLFLLSFNLIAQKVAETITYSGQQWYLDKKVKPVGNVIATYSRQSNTEFDIKTGSIFYTTSGSYITLKDTKVGEQRSFISFNNPDEIYMTQWRKSLPGNTKWQYYYKSKLRSGKIIHFIKYYNDLKIRQVPNKPKEGYTANFDLKDEENMITMFEDQIYGKKFTSIYASHKLDAF